VHLVTANYDAGTVLAQTRVPVHPEDDLASLGERVRTAEKTLLVGV